MKLPMINARLPFFNLLSEKDLRLLYYNRLLREMVNQLVFFLIPIYLYQLGPYIFPTEWKLSNFQSGFLLITLIFGLMRAGVAILIIPLNQIGVRIGYQRTLVLSYLARILQMATLFGSIWAPYLVFVSALLDALQIALYWPSYHTLITQRLNIQHIGKSVGILQFFQLLIAAIIPAIAGIVSTQIGFSLIFFIGILGSVSGLILSLMLSANCDYDQLSFTEFRQWLKEKRYKLFSMATAGRQMHEVALFLWPLYLLFMLGSVEKVGFIFSLALLLALIITVIIIPKLDKSIETSYFKISGVVLAISWIVRSQITSVLGIALVDALNKVVGNYHWIYYDMIWYKRGSGGQAHSYFVYYELVLSIALIGLWITLSVVVLLTNSWTPLFIIGGLGAMLSSLMKKNK